MLYTRYGLFLDVQEEVFFGEAGPENVLEDISCSAVTMLIGKIQHERYGSFALEGRCMLL